MNTLGNDGLPVDKQARPPYRASFDHRWHVGINAMNQPGAHRFDDMHFMYEAKSAFLEVPRLALLFRMEREKRLAAEHRQCSRHHPVPVHDNHLTCCLGVECRACPYLAALDAADLSDSERDTAKAWTCATHINSKGGDVANEGYILTTDDRMYWDTLYRSLASAPPEDEAAE